MNIINFINFNINSPRANLRPGYFLCAKDYADLQVEHFTCFTLKSKTPRSCSFSLQTL